MKSFDALIIGGGIAGCSTAYYMGRLGWRVVVIEKDYPGRHASGVNSGGVRALGRHLSELPLALHARRIWTRMEELFGDDGGFRAVGNVRIAETEQQFQSLVARSHEVAKLGLDYRERILDQAELRQLLPALALPCAGALYVPDDGLALPFRVTHAIRQAAAKNNAVFLESRKVIRIDKTRDKWVTVTDHDDRLSAPWIINCAGGWGQGIARWLGDDLPLKPDGSMQMVTSRLPEFVTPVVGSATRPLSLKQFPNGTVVIGGGQRAPVDLDTNTSDIDLPAIANAANAAARLFPILRKAQIVRVWSGIEGFTPDRLPIIGHGSQPGVYHAFGFSGHGFQIGPAVGEMIAETIIADSSSVNLTAFSPLRFRPDPTADGFKPFLTAQTVPIQRSTS